MNVIFYLGIVCQSPQQGRMLRVSQCWKGTPWTL